MAWSSGLIEPTRTQEPIDEKSGTLSVLSEPPGLDVSLDGAGIGKPPIISKVLGSGIYILRGKGEKTEIYITPGKNLRVGLYKGSFIEFPAEKNAVRPQEKPDDLKTPKKPKLKQPSPKKRNCSRCIGH